MTLPLSEARKNEELVSLADSQVLRWIDELNGVVDGDARAREIKAKIKAVRREVNSLQNRKTIRRLYAELDEIQFKPDYMCLIIDRERDYWRACNGFSINGITYHRLLGTNGGVKNETIVFISDRVGAEIRRRIDNGRDINKELVPAKLEAYKALACSASIPVSLPRGIILVNDCETEFVEDIVYLDDEQDGEPVMEYRNNVPVGLTESDGYGLMLPSLAQRWGEELGLDYTPGGVNTRFSWEKGMLYAFDFVDFGESIAKSYYIQDAWGVQRDIRQAEVIMTTSMLKLWDSYSSMEEYLRNCSENKYEFSITKASPETLEDEHNLNYQFTQSYDLSDDDVEELVSPTVCEIEDILNADHRKTVLYLKGSGLTESNVMRSENDFAKAIMADERMINDPYVQSRIYQIIKNRINEAKVGVIKVRGNYSMISGDPYALCQSSFGLEVTGLLAAGEIYNDYWDRDGAERLACFRAPMSCHPNIRCVNVCRTPEARYWYRYMTSCTMLNAWDTIAHALNGADKDGDLIFLTNNPVLVERQVSLPAVMCVQRKAQKTLVTEEDAIQANINSFGDDIGKVTNRITSMFEVQSKFSRDSQEYKELDYRIMCGQLLQQNAIDKAKGIISKPMPKEWYDRHSVLQIEDQGIRDFYLSIVADRKPYFMTYIYPDLMQRYNKFVRNSNRKAMLEFGVDVAHLQSLPEEWLTQEQHDFLKYYNRMLPVGLGDCVQNRICRKIESEFDGYLSKVAKVRTADFDYTIMKSGAAYTRYQFSEVKRLCDEYGARLREYMIRTKRECIDQDESNVCIDGMKQCLLAECCFVCSDHKCLCDIMLDICYRRGGTKQLAWDICAETIIENLIERNGGHISFPTKDENGDIYFNDGRFSYVTIKIGGSE